MFCKRAFAQPLLLAIVAAQAPAQPQERSSFEVASIKLHPGDITFSSDPSIHGRRVTATASTLLDLITYAYGLRYDQITGGPAWAGSDHYDLDAEADSDHILTTSESRLMVQSLLADRFQLKVRRVTQEAPVYALVIGKNGPKLKAADADAKGGWSIHGTGTGLHMETTKGTMEQLARQLSFTAGRPVVDRTNLAGYYVYTLDWFPADRIAPPELDVLSMFDALREQLGLKLESGKGPVEKLLIEHAEKPSRN